MKYVDLSEKKKIEELLKDVNTKNQIIKIQALRNFYRITKANIDKRQQ